MQQQILTLLVGNAGIQLGQAYWNQMMLEHNQNDQRNQILFDEIKEQKIARCLLIDQDSSSIDKILSSSNYKIYNPDNMFAGKQGSQNLFSNGYHIQNIQYFDQIMDQVQKILEQVDNLHAIQFIYSIAGGCGSGLGSKLSEKICDHYTNIPIIHHIIQPSEVERNPLASYNTVLAFQNLVEFSQTVFLHDNQTIIDSNCFTKGLGDINKVITQIMSNHTCSMRFNGLYKTDCLKFQVQTNPFPALHFFSSSLIPLKEFDNKYISRFDQLSERIINKNCSTFKIKEYVGILSGQIVYRGDICSSELDKQQSFVQKALPFVDWLPAPLGIQHSDNGKNQVSLFLQGQFLIDEWKRIVEQFSIMFKKESYLYKYISNGMEKMDFASAEANFIELLNQYVPNDAFNFNEEQEHIFF